LAVVAVLPAYTALGFISHSAFLDKIKDALDAESRLARLAVTPSCNETMESADSAWQRKGASWSV
jgi:6-phosphogluconate dehydrogenase